MYPIDKPLSERLSVLRVILTVFIVYIHLHINNVNFADRVFILSDDPVWLWASKNAIVGVITRAAVPLFFLISSLLLYAKPFTWLGNIKKKCRTILIPYFFWNTFWLLFFYAAQRFPFTQPFFATRIIREYTPLQFLAAYLPVPGMGASPFNYPFWFLRDLFVLNLLAKGIKLLADKLPVLFTAACFTAWLFSLDLIVVSSEGLFFFLLGYHIAHKRLDVRTIDSLAMSDLFAAWLVSVAVATPLYGTYPPLLKISILIGVVFFIRLSGLIISCGNRRLKALFSVLAPYTFIIYAFHDWFGRILGKLLVRLLAQTPAVQLLEFLLLPVITVCGCLLVGILFRQLAPNFYKLVTGNR